MTCCDDPNHAGLRPMQELYRHSIGELEQQLNALQGQQFSRMNVAVNVVARVNQSMQLGRSIAQVHWTAQRILANMAEVA